MAESFGRSIILEVHITVITRSLYELCLEVFCQIVEGPSVLRHYGSFMDASSPMPLPFDVRKVKLRVEDYSSC